MSEHELQVMVQDGVLATAAHSPSTGGSTFSTTLTLTQSKYKRQRQSERHATLGMSLRKDQDNRVTRNSNAVTASGDQPYMFYDLIEMEDAQVRS